MREYALVLLVTAAVTYLLTPLVRRVAIAIRAMHEPALQGHAHQADPAARAAWPCTAGWSPGCCSPAGCPSCRIRSVPPDRERGRAAAGRRPGRRHRIRRRPVGAQRDQQAGRAGGRGRHPGLERPGAALAARCRTAGHSALEPDRAIALTILVVVVTINAVNFIDGLDGLAAGIVARGRAVVLRLLLHADPDRSTAPRRSCPRWRPPLLAGMCIGFLPHNFYPARIFMGDIGAMLLGLLLAYARYPAPVRSIRPC